MLDQPFVLAAPIEPHVLDNAAHSDAGAVMSLEGHDLIAVEGQDDEVSGRGFVVLICRDEDRRRINGLAGKRLGRGWTVDFLSGGHVRLLPLRSPFALLPER
ncbi:hypothetical protein D3C72_2075890 [compost metagenome]